MTKKPSKSKKIDLLPFWGREILEKSLSITVPFFRVLEIEILHWQFRFFKPRKKSVFLPNYRTHTRTLITTNCKKANNIEFAIALFPFILTLFLLIRAQSKGHLSSYIVKDTLPGICVSPQNLSWETFREITLKKIVSLNEHEILRIQDFLKRFDVSSNLILLEMKPAWEQKQKQFYIGFLPEENQIDLNKLRILNFYSVKPKLCKNQAQGIQGIQPSLFFDQKVTFRPIGFSFPKEKVAKNEIVHISNSPLQIKNTKNDNKEKFFGFYARKQNFLRSYKDKINLKRRLIDKKPNLINIFLKQQFQQKLFDLDELPLKLDQNCSEVLPMLLNSSITDTTRINSSHTSRDSKANLKLEKSSLATYPLQRKGHMYPMLSQAEHTSSEAFSCASLNSSILTTRGSLIPNLFENLQLSGVTEKLNNKSDLLVFSSNKKRKIHNIENGIADQTKLLNISSEENISGNVSEENISGNVSEENVSGNVSEENESTDELKENESTDESEENESTDELKENESTDESEENESTDELKENESTDESEENESTDESEENESTDERLPLPNESTQNKSHDQEDQKPVFIKKLLEKSQHGGEEETFYKKLFIENELKKVFYNEEFFPLNLLEKKNKGNQEGCALSTTISLLLKSPIRDTTSRAQQGKGYPRGLISSRLMSGYLYPDMGITNLRSSRIQNLCKNIIFQNQNKELLSMKIELPSSFLTNSFESQPNQIACLPSHEIHSVLTDAKKGYKKHDSNLLCGSEGPKRAYSNEFVLFSDEEEFEIENLDFTTTNLPNKYLEIQDESDDDAFNIARSSAQNEKYEEEFEIENLDFITTNLPDRYHEIQGESGDDAFNIARSSKGNELVLREQQLKSSINGHNKRYEPSLLKSSILNPKKGNIEDFFKVPQFKFNYLPTTQTVLNKSSIEKLNWSGIYQKIPTIYKQEINLSSKPFALLPLSLWGDFPLGENVRPMIQNSVIESSIRRTLVLLKPFLYFQKPFREFWEPVTIQSWLVITKLSFAFIALKMAQSLLLNYGKELVFLGFLSENLKEEIGLTDKKKDKGYRLIKKVEKRFKDVAGIDNILPELGEMVWVLRNSGRSFKVGRVLPKGFLFVGPPGTGKTLLVQAIAGEAEVPVLVHSGSSLTDAGEKEENEKGAQRLTKLFEQARKVAPCIVFIDEIDTLGESRQNVMSKNVGADDLIQSLHKSNQELTEKNSSNYVNTDKAGNITEKKSRGGFTLSENLQHNSSIETKKKAKQQANQEQLHLLMQFLVELDGLKSRAGIIVIGATNRPKVLDPALTRPGRFDRVLHLELPGKTKRIEILKFYSQNLGCVPFYGETKKQTLSTTYPEGIQRILGGPSFEEGKPKESLLRVGEKRNQARDTRSLFAVSQNEKITTTGSLSDISNINHAFGDQDFDWEYLANRTFGLSAAGLAAAMNLSSIQAILRNTGHTIETIEQGIEFITTYSIEKPKKGIQRRLVKIEDFKEKLASRDTKIEDKGHYKQSTARDTTNKGHEKDPFFITRFAYYQAGKAVLHTLLPQHPDAIVLKLWPRPKNSRHKNVNKDQELYSSSLNHRAKLETRLIGLYAGKAAELVALSLNSQTKKQTTNTRKKTSTIKENKGPNRKTVSLLRTKDVSDVSFLRSAKRVKIFDFNKPWKRKDEERDTYFKQKNQQFYCEGNQKDTRNFSQYNKRNLSHSSLGIEDLSVASNLAHSLVEKWHFYSNKIAIRRENQIFTNQNQFEISEIAVFDLFQQLTEDVQNIISASNISESTDAKQRIQRKVTLRKREPIGLSSPKDTGRDKHSRYNFQEWSIRPWWQNQITEQTGNLNMFYDDWYRIYLRNPQESEHNEEWVTPDEYYHNTQNLKNLLPKSSLKSSILTEGCFKIEDFNSSLRSRAQQGTQKSKILTDTKNKLNFDLTWNDLYKLDRDYIYHALILTCFNNAFCLLDENRELLDYLTDYLMRFETLRQHKIKQIFYDFGSSSLPNQSLTKTAKKDKQKINFIFDKNWGKNSRRSSSRLFSFDQ
uniref:Cell division protein n=1 Tax=Trebouxia aggregata TaxID=160068 RepID=G8XPA1_9CHLO|nr:cell division protein [Trebouxia aggregata]